ncbi:hypothetical protein BOX15_Mlig001435g6, partial [Macrostomum lignano]
MTDDGFDYVDYRQHEDPGDDPGSRGLMQMNMDLRKRLDDEQQSYKRKLATYQEGQQRQAQLVQKLQAKVLAYKKKVSESDLENQRLKTQLRSFKQSNDSYQFKLDSETRLRSGGDEDHSSDLESALIRLEEEQQRSASLAHVNAMLREQLDQATQVNQSLTEDMKRLSEDFQRTRSDLERRESEWRDEEASFSEYFSSEHNRLLSLWRNLVSFRRQFNELKTANERDLNNFKNEMTRQSRGVHAACQNLNANLKSAETQGAVALDQERSGRANLESALRERTRELQDLQAKFEAHQADLSGRVNELSVQNEKLKFQLAEKDRTLSHLQRLRSSGGGGSASRSQSAEPPGADDAATRALIEETEAH